MKLYVDVQLATDTDLIVEGVRIKGAAQRQAFEKLATFAERVMRRYAREVAVQRYWVGAAEEDGEVARRGIARRALAGVQVALWAAWDWIGDWWQWWRWRMETSLPGKRAR